LKLPEPKSGHLARAHSRGMASDFNISANAGLYLELLQRVNQGICEVAGIF
jgi:hypothetical protein